MIFASMNGTIRSMWRTTVVSLSVCIPFQLIWIWFHSSAKTMARKTLRLNKLKDSWKPIVTTCRLLPITFYLRSLSDRVAKASLISLCTILKSISRSSSYEQARHSKRIMFEAALNLSLEEAITPWSANLIIKHYPCNSRTWIRPSTKLSFQVWQLITMESSKQRILRSLIKLLSALDLRTLKSQQVLKETAFRSKRGIFHHREYHRQQESTLLCLWCLASLLSTRIRTIVIVQRIITELMIEMINPLLHINTLEPISKRSRSPLLPSSQLICLRGNRSKSRQGSKLNNYRLLKTQNNFLKSSLAGVYRSLRIHQMQGRIFWTSLIKIIRYHIWLLQTIKEDFIKLPCKLLQTFRTPLTTIMQHRLVMFKMALQLGRLESPIREVEGILSTFRLCILHQGMP